MDLYFRAFIIWIFIAVLEVIHGIFFKGRLLAFGMLFLVLSPYLVGKIRHLW
jgi:hypothetical protein